MTPLISVITFIAGCFVGGYYVKVIRENAANDRYINIRQFHERTLALKNVMHKLQPRNEHDIFAKVLVTVSSEVMLKSKTIRGSYPGLHLTRSLLLGYKSRLAVGMQEICEKYIEILADWLHADERRVG